MKAIVVREWTDPRNLRLEEISEPEPQADEVRIAVHTTGVVFGDTLIAAGRYQVRPNLPFVPCSECTGVVERVGVDVVGFAPGDRVAALGFIGDSRANRRILGALAEKTVSPPRNLLKLPDGLSMETAALFRSNNETSYYALQRSHLKPGETLLVLGAGGGTGFAAVELGKLLGARVIGSASSAAKREIAVTAGADAVVDSMAPDWREQIFALTAGRGVDIVYDPIGGEHSERAFRCLAYNGRFLVVGFAAGSIPSLALNLPLMKGASIIGANLLRGWEVEPDIVTENAERLMAWFGEGKLHVPPLTKIYPLDQAGHALADVASGKIAGRIAVAVASDRQLGSR